jgi:hypothetical protein
MKLRLFHEDPYELTAEAIVSCLEQYQSRERRPGLWSQAHFVDTQLFFASLRDKGAQITGNFSL